VDRAATSEEALRLARRNRYDAILCDLNLDSETGLAISGFDLHDRICEILEARSCTRPLFIFMTGDLVEPAVSEQACREGNRFLQKPFLMTELQALLEEVFAPAGVLQPKNSSS
jgi:CheY-like chemotaxis protein